MIFLKDSIGFLNKLSLYAILFTLSVCSSNALQLPSSEINNSLQQKAMPELGEGQLARILSRYYNIGLGGLKAWEKINSLKISGTLTFAQGPLELYAYQRKPNLYKLNLRKDQLEMVLSHDGDNAWQKKPGQTPEYMPSGQARGFKHGSIFGNYLLYPHASGKEIIYIGTVTIDGEHCHHVRVRLQTKFQVDYFFSVHSYLNVKVDHTDLLSGNTNSIFYRDYIRVAGIPIPTLTENHESGKWMSTLSIDEVKPNLGLAPWIFRMPKLVE